MIFSADQARLIERGGRRTIRVPVDRRLSVSPLRPAGKGEARPFVPMVEELLAIAHPVKRVDPNGGPSKDGWETVCHVRIESVRRGPLGTLTDVEARAEGYGSFEEFVIGWTGRHDAAWLAGQVRQLVEAGVEQDDAEETAELFALNRFPARWAAREVWVIGVRVERDLDLHLLPAADGRSERGYVLGGADVLDAGGVVLAGDVADRWMRQAAKRHLEAIGEHASPQERSRRARYLGRRVRELALQDPKLTRRIEELVRDAERDAA